jgi:hypothetical protein
MGKVNGEHEPDDPIPNHPACSPEEQKNVQIGFGAVDSLALGSTEHLTDMSITAKEPPISGQTDHFFEVTCVLTIEPFDQSFVDRKLILRNVGIPELEYRDSYPGVGMVVDFRGLSSAADVRLTGGSLYHVERPDTQRFLQADDYLVAEWKDEKSVQLRDIALIFVGSLLGLASSCLLEWIRPYVTSEK